MPITVVTPPAFDAVSAADMISFLRLNDTSESALITSLVEAATDQFTNDTGGHVLCSQTLRLNLDHWPHCQQHYRNRGYSYFGYRYLPEQSIITIPRGPVTSVTSVEYLDVNAAWQNVVGWTSDTTSPVSRVVLPTNLPTLHASQIPAVRVTFVAGYASAGVIPPSALVGVRLLASHWYDQRAAFTTGELKDLPAGWQSLCGRYALGLTGVVN